MIAAAHSDSPSFKIKANPEVKAGPYVKLNVEKYGGMLIAPWFDRPLSVAGRLIVQDENGGLTTRLVNVDRDLLMLPSLAIHMDREANSGHAFNVQNEVMPLFGDETSAGHFMEIVAQAAGVKKEAILGDEAPYSALIMSIFRPGISMICSAYTRRCRALLRPGIPPKRAAGLRMERFRSLQSSIMKKSGAAPNRERTARFWKMF